MDEESQVAESTDAILAQPPALHYARASKELVRAAVLRADEQHRIGRYELRGVLGSGAMGTVFDAVDPQLRRSVAIKVIRRERAAAHPRLMARMFREARALAKIAHPNVVGVFEVGEEAGRRYIVMERVDGEPLDAWVKVQHPWRRVVAAFCQAGRGLAACHARGLVHRDFKPANAIIGTDGRVRVLDLGLVRSVDAETEEGPATIQGGDAIDSSTRTGLVGTPAYLAPECYDGRAADAAADQFSLCVALYEGLYGTRPFAGASAAEIRDAMASGSMTRRRWTSAVPRAIRRALLRGLSPMPSARFASVDALVAALEAGSRPSWTRRAVAAGVGAAGIALYAAGAVVPDGGDCPQRGAPLGPAVDAAVHGLAAVEGSFVERAAADARTALSRHAQEIEAREQQACEATADADPTLAGRREACLRQRRHVLEGVAAVLEQADRAVATRASSIVAAIPPVTECDDASHLQGAPAPPSEPDVLAAVASLSPRVQRARALASAGKFVDAHALARRAVAEAGPLGYAPALAEARLVLGWATRGMGDEVGGVEAYEAAYYEALGAGAISLAAAAARSAALASAEALQDAERAERWLSHAEALYARLGGAAHPDAGRVAETRARIVLVRGESAQAVTLMRGAIELQRSSAGGEVRLPAMYSTLAAMLYVAGEAEAAAELGIEAAEAVERLHGPDHPYVGRAQQDVTLVQLDRGHLREAEVAARRATKIFDVVFPPGHPERAHAQVNLGLVLCKQGRYAQGEPHLQTAAAMLRTSEGAERATAIALTNLGVSLGGQERWDDAAQALEEAVAIVEATARTDHSVLIPMIEPLAEVESGRGNFDQAIRLQQRVLDLREQYGGKQSWQYWTAWYAMSRIDERRGEHELAAQRCEEALRQVRERSESRGVIVTVARGCAESREALGQVELAHGHAAEAVAAIGEQNAHLDLALAWTALARLRSEVGDRAGARKAYTSGLAIANELSLDGPKIRAARRAASRLRPRSG